MADLAVEPITLDQLTAGKVGGDGVFDVLMTTMVGHLDKEYTGQRLKGQDYAQVYLGSLTTILGQSVAFLLQKDEAAGKAALINAQIELTKAQGELIQLEIAREVLTKELIQAQVDKIRAEIISIGIGDLQTKQQTLVAAAQEANIKAETLSIVKKDALIVAQTEKTAAEKANLILEGDNLIAQNCLLKAQYDLTMLNKLQTTAQTTLIQQKVATEKAQVTETGVDANSVIGKQKLLYAAQTDGFARDAEQKLLKILTDTWNVRRTTDDGTEVNAQNLLYDATIGRLVTKAATGIGA